MTETVIVYRSQMDQLRDQAFVNLMTAEWAFPAICGIVVALLAYGLMGQLFHKLKSKKIHNSRRAGENYHERTEYVRQYIRAANHAHWIISTLIGCMVFWFMM